jgi:hypothetical protein
MNYNRFLPAFVQKVKKKKINPPYCSVYGNKCGYNKKEMNHGVGLHTQSICCD